MRSSRLSRLAAGAFGGTAAILLVLATITVSPNHVVQVSQVWWVSDSYSNQTGPPGGCLGGMPRASGGVSSTTSSWFYASTDLVAASPFVGSCYVFDIWVEPAGFVFVNIPGDWFPVNGSIPISLNISTPSTAFGPAPIYVHFDTSTTPGCGLCP